MYRIDFCGEEECNSIMVFDMEELMSVLNYIDENDYNLHSVTEDDIFLGLESFEDFKKWLIEEKKKEKKIK